LIYLHFLGLTIAIGGQYYRWNDALQSGFWPIVGTLFFNGLGYICMICCLSEMTSTLPFSGGIYGFVRAFLGPYSGYVASRFEIVLDICYAASAVIFLGSFTHDAGLSHHTVEPAWWCLMFGIAMTISLVGGKLFWTFNNMVACTITVLLVMYILGSFAAVNYNEYADGTAAVEGREVVRQVHHTSGMFLGLQYLPLMSGMCKEVSGNTAIAIVFHSFSFCISHS
jgi:ethanolamine permease